MPRRFTLTFPLLLISAGMAICATTQAPPPPPAEVARERAVTAESFVNERLAIWQKRLKLEDWHISAKLVRTTELKPKTVGNIHWDTPTKTANIKVLALADYKLSFQDALRDMEFTVVHELVHLQLSSLPRSDASRGAEERAVNQLTEALLELAGRR